MARFETVPMVDVNTQNFKEVWPTIILAIKSATFVALDTELSGLGQRGLLFAKMVEDRYKGIATSARSRAIVSMGLSCFKLLKTGNRPRVLSSRTADGENMEAHQSEELISEWTYIVQTFNIVVLCQDEYVVEPASLTFLVDHGFDFNRQYAYGIPYYRGNDKGTDKEAQSLRKLFTELLVSGVPVTFHNALVDLVFLYQNLYANLPPTFDSFLADLTEMFPGGILDTKYVTDYVHRMPASYLEYVFRKCQRHNIELDKKVSVCVKFPSYPDTYPHITHCKSSPFLSRMDQKDMGDTYQTWLTQVVCEIYASHGNCSKGQDCPKSHDVDLILDLDSLKQTSKSRRRKRRRNPQSPESADDTVSNGKPETMETSMAEDVTSLEKKMEAADSIKLTEADVNTIQTENKNILETFEGETSLKRQLSQLSKDKSLDSRSGGHRAGFDAFMTGYIMATYWAQQGSTPQAGETGIESLKNKVYLGGKPIPLSVVKSAFAKTSGEHKQKMDRMKQL